LCGGKALFKINDAAIRYLNQKGLAQVTIKTLRENRQEFENIDDWDKYLNHFKIPLSERERILLTEGVMYGGVVSRGFMKNIPIISDEAGQFNLFHRGLCWFHAERKIEKLIPANDKEIKDIELVKSEFWNIYDLLKEYKAKPKKALAKQINNLFAVMCKHKVFSALDKVLKSFAKMQSQLLMVLKYPSIPLHNNLSESDIREQVKKRKISGSTRNEDGRLCRDTFASLKKTCKKLGLTFWQYLLDRESSIGKIKNLSELLKNVLCGNCVDGQLQAA
jgi:hypothetical protein